MRTRRMLVAGMPLALALLTTPAFAHGHHHGDACRQDLQTLCPDVTPGPGGFHDCLATLCPDATPGPGGFATCLQQHAAQLSSTCQQQLSKMQAKMAAWQQACGADVQSFCSDAGPGPWKIGKCLRSHQSELSQTCQDLLAQHHHHGANPTPEP